MDKETKIKVEKAKLERSVKIREFVQVLKDAYEVGELHTVIHKMIMYEILLILMLIVIMAFVILLAAIVIMTCGLIITLILLSIPIMLVVLPFAYLYHLMVLI
jgi:uncharacterized BrkB/YihY/UPF0761 family membrane protein